MSKHWKWLGAGLMALLVCGLASTLPTSAAKPQKPPPEPPPGPPPPSYTMKLLPLPAGYAGGDVEVWGMNNHGDVVGRAHLLGLANHAWVYVADLDATFDLNDSNHFLAVPDGWTIDCAFDINDSGQIAGSFWRWDADGQQRWHAYRYTPGVGFEELLSPDGSLEQLYPWSEAVAINELGDVAGYVESDGAVERRAFVWTEEGGMKQIIPGWASARDMNEAGEVTGYMRVNGYNHAFRYSPPGEIKDLGVLPRRTHSYGYGINILGQVAGHSFGGTSTNWTRAFRYSDSTGMLNLGTLSGKKWSESRADAINDSGHVVGNCSEGAFLYTDEAGMVDLVALIADPPAGLGSLYTESMNDFPDHEYGQICGDTSVDGVNTAFVLTPDR